MPFKTCSFCRGISFQDPEEENCQCPYCDSAIFQEQNFESIYEEPLKH